MAFTEEARAKALATQRENRERKAAGLPPVKPKRAASRRRARPAARPTITLTPPDLTASAAPAPQTLGDPGQTPAAALHQTLLIVFGPINYLLERSGGFDLTEEEFNLIFVPLERIIVRRGIGASGQVPPDLFDALQVAVGVLTYGVRVAPKIAARRDAGGRGAGSRPGPAQPGGRSATGGNQTPGAAPGSGVGQPEWTTITPESIFADVGYVAANHSGNGHDADAQSDPRLTGSSGSSGG